MRTAIDFDAVHRGCAERNTRLEGIEMVLVLEDLTGASAPQLPELLRADGARLAQLEHDYLRSRGLDEGAVGDRDLQQAAEVAAAIDFGQAAHP